MNRVFDSSHHISRNALKCFNSYATHSQANHYSIGRINIFLPSICVVEETMVVGTNEPGVINDTDKYIQENNKKQRKQQPQYQYKKGMNNQFNQDEIKIKLRQGRTFQQQIQQERIINNQNIWEHDATFFDQINFKDYQNMIEEFESREQQNNQGQDAAAGIFLCRRYTNEYVLYKQYDLLSGRELPKDKFLITKNLNSNTNKTTDEMHTLVFPTVYGIIFQIQLLQRETQKYDNEKFNINQILGSPEAGKTIALKLQQMINGKINNDIDIELLERLLYFYQQINQFETCGVNPEEISMFTNKYTSIFDERYNKMGQEFSGSKPRMTVFADKIECQDFTILNISQSHTNKDEHQQLNMNDLLTKTKELQEKVKQFECELFQKIKKFEQICAHMKRYIEILNDDKNNAMKLLQQ